MPLLRQVVSTDNHIGQALTKRNQQEVGKLQELRSKQIMAVGIGLSGITANALPKVLKHGQGLSLLRREDEATLLKALIVLIGLTNEALNVPRMTAAQMTDAARHITKTFWYFKPEEIAYVFDQGRAGRYGKAYNRLDLEILENWLTAYDTDERLALCERGRSEPGEEEETRLSVETVRESYQRFAEGEPTIQQKKVVREQAAALQARRERYNFHVFKETYFQRKKATDPVQDPGPEPAALEMKSETEHDLPDAHPPNT